MISDFIKSRFANSNQPLTARLVFENGSPEKSPASSADHKEKSAAEKHAEAAATIKAKKQELQELQDTVTKKTESVETETKNDSVPELPGRATEKPERTTDEIIKHNFSEDIQKHLDTLDKYTQLGEKLPSDWFTVEPTKGETLDQKVNEIYEKLFGKNSKPLQEQFEAYKAKYSVGEIGEDEDRHPIDRDGKPITIETMVFGRNAAEDAAIAFHKANPNENPKQTPEQKAAVIKQLEISEKSKRLEAIRNQLEDLGKLRENDKSKISAKNMVKNVSEGWSNTFESFQENLTDHKWVEAGIQAAGMYLLLKSAWILFKKKPDDQDYVSYLTSIVWRAAAGVAILMPDATRSKHNLANMLKLTSAADDMDDSGLAKLMKEQGWRNRTEAEALNALAKVDIEKIHTAYKEARSENKSEIDPRQLLGKNAPKKSILNSKELFNVVEKTLERYGAKYFESVMGRPPKTSQEVQDGITLCVRSHKVVENQSKTLLSVIADEERSFDDWKYPERVEGKLLIIKDIAVNIGMSILHPTQSLEHLGEVFYKWLDIFEIDRTWFDTHITDKAKKQIKKISEAGGKKADKIGATVKDFAVSQWALIDAIGAKTYISAITEKGVETTVELAGATISGIYEIGKGLVDVAFEVGGHLYTNAKVYVEKDGTLGHTIVLTQWIPYRFNTQTKKWDRASIADELKGGKEIIVDGTKYIAHQASDKIDFAAGWWGEYLTDTLPQQWKNDIKPMLEKAGLIVGGTVGAIVVGSYEFFVAFTIAAIRENIIPAAKATGKGLAEFFTDDNNLIRSFYKAAKAASAEKLKQFMQGSISLADFLKEYADEVKNREKNIKQFNDIVSQPAEEQKYFGGAIDDPKLKNLEPCVRAWMFEHLSWWSLDMSASAAKFDATSGFIEYDDITLESIGTFGALPFFGNQKCKLRINFAADGNLNGKTRFELTPEGGKTLNFNTADFEQLQQKVEAEVEINERKQKLDAVKKILGDSGDGKITLGGRIFERVEPGGGLPQNFDWLTTGQFYKYHYTDATGAIAEIGIPTSQSEKYYLNINGENSYFGNVEELQKKAAGTFDSVGVETNKAFLERKNKVDGVRNMFGDNGQGYFEINGHQFQPITLNGGLDKEEDWLKPNAYFTYKYTDKDGEYFVKILSHTEKTEIIVEAPSKDKPLKTDSTTEARNFLESLLDKELDKKISLVELFNPPAKIHQGERGILRITEAPLNTNLIFANGATLEKVTTTYLENGKQFTLSEVDDEQIIVYNFKDGKLRYVAGHEVEPRKYSVQIDLEMEDQKKSLVWDVEVIK